MEDTQTALQNGIQYILEHISGPGFTLSESIKLRDQFFLSAILCRDDSPLAPLGRASLREAALQFLENPDERKIDAMLNFEVAYTGHRIFSPSGASVSSLGYLVAAQQALVKIKPIVEGAVRTIMENDNRRYDFKIGRVSTRQDELAVPYWFVEVSVRDGEDDE